MILFFRKPQAWCHPSWSVRQRTTSSPTTTTVASAATPWNGAPGRGGRCADTCFTQSASSGGLPSLALVQCAIQLRCNISRILFRSMINEGCDCDLCGKNIQFKIKNSRKRSLSLQKYLYLLFSPKITEQTVSAMAPAKASSVVSIK